MYQLKKVLLLFQRACCVSIWSKWFRTKLLCLPPLVTHFSNMRQIALSKQISFVRVQGSSESPVSPAACGQLCQPTKSNRNRNQDTRHPALRMSFQGSNLAWRVHNFIGRQLSVRLWPAEVVSLLWLESHEGKSGDAFAGLSPTLMPPLPGPTALHAQGRRNPKQGASSICVGSSGDLEPCLCRLQNHTENLHAKSTSPTSDVLRPTCRAQQKGRRGVRGAASTDLFYPFKQQG